MVDSGASTGFGPDGAKELSVACDGETHEISTTALSDAGAGVTESKEVEPG